MARDKSNGASAQQAAESKPEIGRNNCTDETRREYYRSALLAKIAHESALATAKTKNAEYRNVLKAASKAGVDSKAIVAVLADRFQDEDELVIQLREQLKMFDLAGVIPNIADKILKRLEIEEPTRNEVEQITLDRAFDGGARDGREGKPREANPHPPGSDHHAMHDRGYLQGMAAIAAEMAPQPPAEAQ